MNYTSLLSINFLNFIKIQLFSKIYILKNILILYIKNFMLNYNILLDIIFKIYFFISKYFILYCSSILNILNIVIFILFLRIYVKNFNISVIYYFI